MVDLHAITMPHDPKELKKTSFQVNHPGGNPGANLKSISHRCHPILVAFVWELTRETIHLPLGCLQGGRTESVRWKLGWPSCWSRGARPRISTTVSHSPGKLVVTFLLFEFLRRVESRSNDSSIGTRCLHSRLVQQASQRGGLLATSVAARTTDY